MSIGTAMGNVPNPPKMKKAASTLEAARIRQGLGQLLFLLGRDFKIRLIGSARRHIKVLRFVRIEPFRRDGIGFDVLGGRVVIAARSLGRVIVLTDSKNTIGNDSDNVLADDRTRFLAFVFEYEFAILVGLPHRAPTGIFRPLDTNGLETHDRVGVGFAIDLHNAGNGGKLGAATAPDHGQGAEDERDEGEAA